MNVSLTWTRILGRPVELCVGAKSYSPFCLVNGEIIKELTVFQCSLVSLRTRVLTPVLCNQEAKNWVNIILNQTLLKQGSSVAYCWFLWLSQKPWFFFLSLVLSFLNSNKSTKIWYLINPNSWMSNIFSLLSMRPWKCHNPDGSYNNIPVTSTGCSVASSHSFW